MSMSKHHPSRKCRFKNSGTTENDFSKLVKSLQSIGCCNHFTSFSNCEVNPRFYQKKYFLSNS